MGYFKCGGGSKQKSKDFISGTSASNWIGTSGSPTITKDNTSLKITASGYADTYTEFSASDLLEIKENALIVFSFSEDRGSNDIEIQISENGSNWSSIYSVANALSVTSYATVGTIISNNAKIRIRYKNSSSQAHVLTITTLRLCY